MKKLLGSLIALTLAGFFLPSPAKAQADTSPLPGCTVQQVEAGVAACDPQGPEVGGGDDVDAADCSVEGECQGTPTGNTEGEGAYDAGGDDAGTPPGLV